MSVRPSHADPELTKTAERLATDLLGLDPAILSLMVMDKTGEALVIRRSDRLAPPDYAGDDIVRKLGVQASVVLAAAMSASNIMGRTEYIIGSFSKFKVLIVHLPEYDLSLGIRLTTSSSGEFVYQKIRDTLGTS